MFTSNRLIVYKRCADFVSAAVLSGLCVNRFSHRGKINGGNIGGGKLKLKRTEQMSKINIRYFETIRILFVLSTDLLVITIL